MMKLLQELKKLPGKLFLLPIIGVWLASLKKAIGYGTSGIITVGIIFAWFIFFLIKTKKARGKELETEQLPGVLTIQEELEKIEKKLEHAIKVVGDSKIGQSRRKRSTVLGDVAPYILPWYMLIGKKGCGKTTLLMESGLHLNHIVLLGDKATHMPVGRSTQINPTESCDCFLAQEAVILDTTGRYFFSDEKINEEDKEEWLRFLKLLKRYRRQKPIDGILFTIDVSILLSATDEEIEQEAERSRACIDEVIEKLGIEFPIYLVFTECDLLYGFAQFFEGLENDKRNQIWGYTVSINEQGKPNIVFKEACEQLEKPLNAFRMMKLAKGTTPPQNRRGIAVFPLQFTAAYKKLLPFVTALFKPNPLRRADIPEPMFRGFYFSSATQKGEPIDLVIQREAEEKSFELRPWIFPEAPKETKGYFIKDIFTKVIIPDQDLDKPPVKGWSRILPVVSFIAPIVVSIALVIGIAVSYVQNKRLLYESQKAAIQVKNINPNTHAREIFSRLDRLHQQITKLGFNPLWSGEGNDMADVIAKPYRRAELEYITNIQVNVLKTDYTPIAGAVVYPENSKRRRTVSNKEGLANAEIADSRGEQKLTIELPDKKQTRTISFRIEGNSIHILEGDAEGGIESKGPYINVFFR